MAYNLDNIKEDIDERKKARYRENIKTFKG